MMSRPNKIVLILLVALQFALIGALLWPPLVPQQFTAVYRHNLQEYPTMSKNVTQKMIASHLVEGRMKPGEEIDLWRTIS
jgi:hypothetical protein